MASMGPTIAAMLDLEIFRRTTATVHAGHDQLGRTVRWVHAGEIPDIYRFLSGGEMLLTAGLGIGHTQERQRTYIRRVAGADAAVLVVELAGRAFDRMPEAVVDEAAKHDLPLIGLRDEIPFVEVSAQVHDLLVEARVQELTTEEAINQAFMDLLLAGEDHVAMVHELARRVGHPVVLEDLTHQILAYAGRTSDADAVTSQWDAHSRAPHELHSPSPGGHDATAVPGGGAAVRDGTEVARCARRPIILRGESSGWLHLLYGGAELGRADIYCLDRATTAVAITLLSERASGARAAQRQSVLVNRLLLGDLSGDDFVARASALGRDLRGQRLVAAVFNRSGGREGQPGRLTQPGQFGDQEAAALFRDAGLAAVVADLGDDILAVVALPDGVGDDQVIRLLNRPALRAGISRVVRPSMLPIAARQARNTAAAAATGPEARVLRFDDLGVLRLLITLAQGPELGRYVEDELGEVLRHDAAAANPLLPTLRAYLECDGNKSQAAAALFIQRRTLYYRLERLGGLLGASLNDPAVRHRLLLAVRGHDLLRRPAEQ